MRKFLNTVLLLIALLAIFPLYSRFKAAAAPVAPGVFLGGLDLSNVKSADEIQRHLDRIYSDPIEIIYADARLVLKPDAVDFTVDVDQMLGEAGRYLEGPEFMDIAMRQALGFEQRRRDVPVRYLLNVDKLRSWLEEVAAEQDRAPQRVRLLPPGDRWIAGSTDAAQLPQGFVGNAAGDWTWSAGAPGYALDVDASIPVVIKALSRDQERVAELVLLETPSPAPELDDLARALDSVTANFPGFAAIYVQDLVRKSEIGVDDEVAFSGMSTLKIGIVSAVMQRLNDIQPDDRVAAEVGQWIDFALGESNNYAANLLLSWLGDGNTGAGAQRFTSFMRNLGYTSTYMQSGYDVETQLAQIPTPGNQRDDWTTNADTNLQATPREMGRLLSEIYHCTNDEGLLRERYAEEITPAECAYILFYMGHDEFEELLWSGIPDIDQAWIVHKHGFAFESHSDVALIWGPTGPYVLSVFLYRSGWMDWETSNSTMKAISRITWNFFEFQRSYLEEEPPTPLELAPPPGYIPINEFVPASS